jgi:5-methylcytosine-specific restriction endonuclease McrA
MLKPNYVFVLDKNKKPLIPCKPSVARRLLNANRAAVFRRFPFTIILKKEVNNLSKSLELNFDPGSKTTGVVIKQGNKVLFAAELTHRGQQIKSNLESRRSIRKSRRNRKTRYRKARFLNRKRFEDWLTPSLMHRVKTTLTWTNKFIKLTPISFINQELVKFDLQKIQNPEISGIEYQQGELQGYEVKEYLLEKWKRRCAYCGIKDVPLQIEHIVPKSKGGSNRISNLSLACQKCNQKKGNQTIKDFLKNKPSLAKEILKQSKTPLNDASVMNSTRWILFRRLKAFNLPVKASSGGQTKFNRTRLNLPKAHWIDAACVGKVESLELLTNQPLIIVSKGWGNRQMIQNDKFGFPRKGYKAKQKVQGFIVEILLM